MTRPPRKRKKEPRLPVLYGVERELPDGSWELLMDDSLRPLVYFSDLEALGAATLRSEITAITPYRLGRVPARKRSPR